MTLANIPLNPSKQDIARTYMPLIKYVICTQATEANKIQHALVSREIYK
jgi:hypothetical protein